MKSVEIGKGPEVGMDKDEATETTTRMTKEKKVSTTSASERGNKAEATSTETTSKSETATTATRIAEEEKEITTPESSSGDNPEMTSSKKPTRAEREPTEGVKVDGSTASAMPQPSGGQGATSKEGDKEKQNKCAERATSKQPVGIGGIPTNHQLQDTMKRGRRLANIQRRGDHTRTPRQIQGEDDLRREERRQATQPSRRTQRPASAMPLKRRGETRRRI